MRKQINREDDLTSLAEIIEPPESISVKEAGRRGGRSTLARRGTAFFREIGAKGGKRQKELYSDLLTEFGKKGGRPKRSNLESVGEGDQHEKEATGGRSSGPSPPPEL